nr:hypothetical protein [Tanacetum cinerariifolium]
RNNALLQDYKSSGKSSVFSDMRIGEQNEELWKLDKKIMRSKLEMGGPFTTPKQRPGIFTADEQEILNEINPIIKSMDRLMHQSGSFVTEGKVVTTMMLLSKSHKGFSHQMENKEVVVLEKNDDNDDGEKEDEEEEVIT